MEQDEITELRKLRKLLRAQEREISKMEQDNLALVMALETAEDERDHARELAMRTADELFLVTPTQEDLEPRSTKTIQIVRDGEPVPWEEVQAQIDAAQGDLG